MQHSPYLKAAVLLAASVLNITSMLGQHGNKRATLVVVPVSELPEAAQMPADSMWLLPAGNGDTFLYLEQQSRHRIVVLNVSAPGKIRAKTFVPLDIDDSFEFVRSAGPAAALVCFRGDKGSGIIDFSQPRHPVLTMLPLLKQASQIEEAGPAGLIISSSQRPYEKSLGTTVQVVDITIPNTPQILSTVPNVFQQLSDSSTGARYLLSEKGLTVVRQPDVEIAHQLASRSN